jgi:hypothetical protein
MNNKKKLILSSLNLFPYFIQQTQKGIKMIKHIVMWTLKEDNKEENAKEMVKRLNELKNKIDVIVSIEAGENITDSDRNYDIALVSEFKTVADLDQYRVHEDHQKVVQFVRSVTDNVVAVDFEF